jgi:hypothetical protein
LEHVGVIVTYVMWREEHIWNVSVLKRVNIFSLELYSPIFAQDFAIGAFSDFQTKSL